MRVLVVGSGGREHALCWAIAASPLLTKLYCAPGNPGIAAVAERVPIDAMDIQALAAFARDNRIDLVVPGPEAPLVAGLADAMDAIGVPCCGPTAAAAQVEGSKAFTKALCDAARIPTARYARFDHADAARAHIRAQGAPIVVKADGLAAGKGVVVAATVDEALAAVDAMMDARVFGDSGASVVIEECLVGEEVSLFALCDGVHAVAMGSAQDHKRAFDGDLGPNTGGMGSYSPVPSFPPDAAARCMDIFVRPALAELARRGTPFRGFLYAGLMLTAEGPKLIEFNARFGDPECQVLLPMLRSDLLPALIAACDGELANFDLRWRDGASVAVVMAANGYPDAPQRGSVIGGLDRAAAVPGAFVFHAGTDADAQGRIVAAGGRVLNLCATGATLREAVDRGYAAVGAVDWPGGFCRRDIGWRALG